MKLRVVALVLLIFMLSEEVSAHTVHLVATSSWKSPNTLTVNIMDAYGTPISNVSVTVSVSSTGGKTSRSMPMVEEPKGTYTAYFTDVAFGTHQFAVESNIMQDLFRGTATYETTRDYPEQLITLRQYERGANVAWELFFFGSTVLVVGGIVFVSLRRAARRT